MSEMKKKRQLAHKMQLSTQNIKGDSTEAHNLTCKYLL